MSIDFAKNGGTNTRHAESETEKQSRDETDFSRHKFLRVDQDGGEGGGENDPDNEGEDAGPEEIGMRKRDREWRDSEDRNPNHEFASVTVADRSAEDGADGDGEEEKKEMELRTLHGKMEFVDEVKSVVIR